MVQMVQQGEVADSNREVTQEQYADLVEQQGQAFRIGGEGAQMVVLYDQIDGSKLTVERQLAVQVHLKKHAAVCSACNAPSLADSKGRSDISNHIQTTLRAAETHRVAEALDMVGPSGTGKRCSACDAVFLSRPHNVHEHIDRAKRGGPLHAHAQVRVINRFSLEPPVLDKVTVTHVTTTISTPQASEEDRREPRRHRRRRRHHKGRSA